MNTKEMNRTEMKKFTEEQLEKFALGIDCTTGESFLAQIVLYDRDGGNRYPDSCNCDDPDTTYNGFYDEFN